MAFVFKHPKSKFWVAGFTDATGKRRNRSTKTTNRKLAEKLAEEYELATRKKRTARQVRQVITDLHRAITGEDMVTMTVQQFVKQWLATKKPETSKATQDFYSGATKRFLEWLGPKAEKEIGDITRDDILAFRNEEAAKTAPKTTNHKLKCLRMIFKAAKRDELIAEDPTEFVETVRQKGEKKRRPFTLDELRAVLAVAKPEWKSMILFGLYTGQRLSDIAMLTWANIDLGRGEIRLVTRKTGKALLLPIATPLQEHLESIASTDDPSAPIHPRAFEVVNKQTRSGSLSNQFADILAEAGLRPKIAHRKSEGVRRNHELSFHCLRATATTLLHEAGVPAAVAQALIGHDSEEIHRLYTKVGKDALRDAATKLPSL